MYGTCLSESYFKLLPYFSQSLLVADVLCKFGLSCEECICFSVNLCSFSMGELAQMVECLLRMQEVLRLIPRLSSSLFLLILSAIQCTVRMHVAAQVTVK